ncbi:putative peptide zinc metalloprotease protein [Enterobacter sp. BIGb0383]|uniref:HlyD family efflux transporter periplasmic adaptor subunit n=1 Tax=unclassified Enterobacter TaxID=2608935 RepID=UPI000FA5E1F5|nr:MULTISPECIES: HlyD family efflux transporter periplasmic adaptor subunit [unclassified Enterobacter]ROP58369.1 putative peptide zinc metalloprotease protein [Enterobacter sp. BIGb0383]ROS06743.1 putative peptide zinc metalloprotease protein [Enterobacter sp. BIGb0359]
MAVLPPLRDDLHLSPAAAARDGSPQWTLADTLSGRYFKLNSTAIRLLRHWALGEPERVMAAANREPGIPLGNDDLEQFLRFLRAHDLIAGSDREQRASYAVKATGRRQSVFKRVLHQYLFFRIPLWRPDPFLNRTWPWLARHGITLLRVVFPLLLLAGVFLVSRDWPRYRSSFPHLFSIEGMLAFGCALIFAKFIHELGHAYMAKKAGCRVQSMGVAFIVMFPMLYTDVSDAWRVSDHRARVLIGAGGILAEMLLATLALLAWSLLPEGPLHSAAFLLSSATWITTVIVNVNPLMRFDGYFMLSDAWRIDNLQGRAWALCRWHLREKLFGYGEAPPERWSPPMTKRLLLWGYASWLWRFFLFFGIALAVYHLFFKVLGLFLMMVEVGWFIVLPIVQECTKWWQQRGRSQPRAVWRTGLGLILLLLVLFFPWRSQVEIPAVLEASRVSTLYAPVAAQVRQVQVKDGQRVEAGEVLLTLTSADLDFRLAIIRQRTGILQLQMRRQAANRDTAGDALILEQELAAALAQYRGLKAQQERLQIRAVQSGVVRDMAVDLTPGRWLDADLPLLRVVSQDGGRLRGYLREDQLNRLSAGASGQFIADDPARAAVPVKLKEIDPTGITFIEHTLLASEYGGPIAVRRDEQKQLRPVQGWYGVSLDVAADLTLPAQPLRGVVTIDGEAESLFTGVWRRIAALGVRESGF